MESEPKEKSNEEPQINGTIVQEATSTTTTPPAERPVEKYNLRKQTWQKLENDRNVISTNNISHVFSRIPNFIGAEEAAAALADLDEFKNAKNIKVNLDHAQDPVKLRVVSSGKNLYLPPSNSWNTLYIKVDCPADADEETKKKALTTRNAKENIDLENKEKMDMVVFGSVLVSRDGYRIGQGNRSTDLDIGILINTGVITPETIIVTTVHDAQVCDKLPEQIFKKYDVPVDIIVTPTQVIRVAKRLPRPEGIYWDLLYERRLKYIRSLQVIKETEEKAGKQITLKPAPENVNGRARRFRNRSIRRRNPRKKSETKTENEEKENVTPRSGDRRLGRRRSRFAKGKNATKSDGEQSSNENKENKEARNRDKMQRRRKKKDFCVEVSNIAKGIRVKDLKAELRKRGCNPIYISWKGAHNKCHLHFSKPNNQEPDQKINDVLNSLSNLELTVKEGEDDKTVKLNVNLFVPRDEKLQSEQEVAAQLQQEPQPRAQEEQKQIDVNTPETVNTTAV